MSGQPRKIEVSDNRLATQLFGRDGENLRRLESVLGVTLSSRGHDLFVDGPPAACELAEKTVRQLLRLLQKGYPLFPEDVSQAAAILAADHRAELEEIFLDTVFVTARQRPVTPRSRNQKRYIEAIRHQEVIFGIGPAGTGKTYLAMAMAVSALMKKEIQRIILTRPAVEAGEKLGFLPGDLAEKVNPYLRPLYDALNDLLDLEKGARLVHRGVIEVAPLAFMRGRTLNDSFIILDEAQNTSPEQMKMFLTRLGRGSRAVVTGDVTQIDLPADKKSGLKEVERILAGVSGIEFVYFDERDVVRHPVVARIIAAYGREDALSPGLPRKGG